MSGRWNRSALPRSAHALIFSLLVVCLNLGVVLYYLVSRYDPLTASRRHSHFMPFKQPSNIESAPFTYELHHRGMNLSIEYILSNSSNGNELLKEWVKMPAKAVGQKTLTLLALGNMRFEWGRLRGCPEWECVATENEDFLPNASAVLLWQVMSENLSAVRQQHTDQYFIHYEQECPQFAPFLGRSFELGSLDQDADYFNMSLTYRWDSVATLPYGYAVKLAESSRQERQDWMKNRFEPIIRGKTKQVAWFVSRCDTPSGRELLMERLQFLRLYLTALVQKHGLQVDIYGGCGPRGYVRKSEELMELLNTDYLFYFAAENSVCKDYMSEKLWNQGYRHLVVPIVLRRAIVEPFVPPHSFIAADDFSSPAEMAAELQRLSENREEYLEYFRWRLSYEVINLDEENHDSVLRPIGLCQVCRLLRLGAPHPPRMVFKKIVKWWEDGCDPDQRTLVKNILKGDGDDEISMSGTISNGGI